MPHHKSAAKRVITNEKARQRNVSYRTRMRSALRAMREAKTREQAQTAYRHAVSILDRTAARGVIKKGTASRYKGRLARLTASLPA